MFRSSGPRLLLAALLLVALVGPARAEEDNYFGIGGHASTSFTPSSDDDASFSFGLQARFRPFRILAIEGSFGVRDEEFADGTLDAKAYPIEASALLFLLSGRFELYALGGVTYLIVDVDDNLFRDNDVVRIPGFHGGAGVQVKVFGPWRAHADVRYLVADDDLNGRTLDYDGATINFGISYWW